MSMPTDLRTWKCAECGKIGKEKYVGKKAIDTFDEEGNRFFITSGLDKQEEGVVFDDQIDEWVLPLCLKCYEKRYGKDANDEASSLLEKGFQLEDSGKYEEAIKCYDRVIEIEPEYVEATFQKTGILIGLGKLEEALRCYDKTIENNQEFAQLWSEKAALLKKMGRHKESMECYKKASKL